MLPSCHETPRLSLRLWKAEDRDPFVAMNADPIVMRYFPSLLSGGETDALLARIHAHFQRHGFGLWAVEVKSTEEFAGFVGLAIPTFEAHFTPCVEIGWRLAQRFWHQGIATEAATKVLQFAFHNLQMAEVVSFTAVDNWPSRRVMERIGMTHNPEDDFDHPRIPKDNALCRHVVYRARSELKHVADGGQPTHKI